MDQDLINKLAEQDRKLTEIYRSVERMRKYFMWTLIITLITIFLPLIGLAFVIPTFLKTLPTAGLGL